MRRRKNKKSNLVLLLLLILGSLGIGYAFLTQELTINGVGNFTNSNWDVHFANLVPNTNITLAGTDSAATINSTTRTDITYQVTLVKPGDFYEFTVDVVNAGSIDAMVGLITNNLNGNPIGTGNELPAYARYTATYSDGVAIAPNHLLEAGESESFKVRLEYRTDINPSDLPGTQTPTTQLTFNFGVSYVQADSNALTKPVPLPRSCSEFTNDSWNTIVSNVHSGIVYEVGCTKNVELGNSLGNHTLRVANISTPSECGTADFSETACGFVLEFADIITTHIMNNSTNVGGWPATTMRTYLNSTSDTTSIYNSLPTVIKDAIVDTSVVSGHGSTSGEANFTSTDKLYLLSSHEVYEDVDTSTYGMNDTDTAYNNTRQLDYYANQGVTTSNYAGAIKQYNGSNDYWWLRSIRDGSSNFILVYSDGYYVGYGAGTMTGVSPAFRIG